MGKIAEWYVGEIPLTIPRITYAPRLRSAGYCPRDLHLPTRLPSILQRMMAPFLDKILHGVLYLSQNTCSSSCWPAFYDSSFPALQQISIDCGIVRRSAARLIFFLFWIFLQG